MEMKFTVQYIPLNKIKPDLSIRMTQHLKAVRRLVWDGMHLLAVRRNKDGQYYVLLGLDRYEYLTKHTNKKFAPCIVEDGRNAGSVNSWLQRLRNQRLLSLFPDMNLKKMNPKSKSIIRAFLKQEPRFVRLSRSQQMKVLLLGIRYKRTVTASMKAMVDDLLSK
jgi:hypothetical protein